MSNINTLFARRLLTQVTADVKKHFPVLNLRTSISGVGPHGRDQFFVQIHADGFAALDDYYSADSLTHAKAKAWMRFLARHVTDYAGDDR